MTVPIEAQLLVILESVLLGAAAGIIYDVLRAIRWHYHFGRLGTALCDAAFCFFALAASFMFGVAQAAGHNRFYVLAGMASGWAVYIFLVSGAVLELLEFLLSGLTFLHNCCSRVVKYAKTRVRDAQIPEKIRRCTKKVWPTPFHFWLKRYKIKEKSVSLRRRQREWRR